MAQRVVFVPEIGEIILSKRKSATRLRLSVSATGKVRVGMPYWTPYQAGIAFAKSKADWITEILSKNAPRSLKNNDLIGKAHRISYIFTPGSRKISTRVRANQITIKSGLPINDHAVQIKLAAACEKALRLEAEKLLPQRLNQLARRNDFKYKEVRIKKLTSRWGSCSSDKIITLSYYLIQLPWPLIDYVILHELVHTIHLNHSRQFWDEFEKVLPGAKALRKEVHAYKPLVQAYHILPNK